MSDDPEAHRGDRERMQPPPPAPTRYADEVSLRELYLVLRRGLPTILVVALTAAAIAAAWLTLRPSAFEAEATVVSAPTTVQVRGEGTLAFEPRSSIAFATYEDVATSRSTFERTIARLSELGATPPETASELSRSATVERLTGPAAAGDATPLTVVHRVTWSDPALAALYADAWAETTVEQVRATLLADLEPARAQTAEALEAREAALVEAESAYRTFQENDLPGIEQELRTINTRIATMQDALVELNRRMSSVAAQRQVLLAQVAASDGATVSADALDLLEGGGRIDPDTAAQLRLLAEPAGGDAASRNVVGLLARADLQGASVELGGLMEERRQLADALDVAMGDAETLRTRVAELRLEQASLSRRVDAARDAYQAVQAIEPALAFVADLTPGNTRVLNTAQEPTQPSDPSTTLIALLAAVVAALAATLFVFLREAVRDPSEPVGVQARSGTVAPTSSRG